LRKLLFPLLASLGWLIIVTILLTIPGNEFPKTTWLSKIWLDKWVHIGLFLVLVIVWCRAYAANKTEITNRRKIFIWLALLGIAYGTLMEIVQHYFIPFRSFETGDVLADGIGAGLGYFYSVKRFLKK
jgi:VanZ family protein